MGNHCVNPLPFRWGLKSMRRMKSGEGNGSDVCFFCIPNPSGGESCLNLLTFQHRSGEVVGPML